MIDHTGFVVSDYPKSRALYITALERLGYTLLTELRASLTGHTDEAGLGKPLKPDF
jgi:hypothetical protein